MIVRRKALPAVDIKEFLLPEDDPRVQKDIDKWAGKTHEVNQNYAFSHIRTSPADDAPPHTNLLRRTSSDEPPQTNLLRRTSSDEPPQTNASETRLLVSFAFEKELRVLVRERVYLFDGVF